MLRNYMLLISIISVLYANVAFSSQPHDSKYSGQESRLIKSLSSDDIKQLEQGKGWGLAKAAELNGVPGPLHLLQMKEQISLSKEQETKIKNLYANMKADAIPLGNQLIQLEKELNDSFALRTVNSESLLQQLEAIAEVRKKLRYVHLATHLETPAILSAEQIHQYNQLRGYNKSGMGHEKGHSH